MSKSVLFITFGFVVGVAGAAISTGFVRVDPQALLTPLQNVAYSRPSAPAQRPEDEALAPDARGAFSFCLHKAGENEERTLRDLLAFHDHEATLALTECLLNVEPARFCGDGAAKAENAMEIYLWSRDVARVRTPQHSLADKIRLLKDRPDEAAGVDPFALTWSGPRDRALFARLRTLARDGYLDPGAFGYSGRAELREAVADVKPQGAPCAGVADVE